MTRRSRVPAVVIGGLLAAASLAGVGCGSDDGSSASTSGAEKSAATEPANPPALMATLNGWYKGRFGQPPTASSPVVKNKSIWLIACNNGIPSCTNVWDVAGGLAKRFGWKVTRVDGKQDPNVMASAIRQAIAAKADAIGISSIDCSTVKAPLAEARAAGIKIVSSTGLDCDPKLFDAENHTVGTTNYKAALQQLGGIEGLWVASKLNPLGGGQVIINLNPFTEAGTAITNGAKAAVTKWCPKCEIVTFVLNAPDFVTQLKVQQKTQAILTKYPKAKAFIALTDDVILAGAGPGIAASGRPDKDFFVASATASPQGIALMKKNSPQEDFNVAISPEGRGYELFDAMNSLFKGEKPVPAGNNWQAFDKAGGLPQGANYVGPVDWAAAYDKRWGVTQ